MGLDISGILHSHWLLFINVARIPPRPLSPPDNSAIVGILSTIRSRVCAYAAYSGHMSWSLLAILLSLET